MKYPAGATTQSREAISLSLSPKLSSTFSEGFSNQYNSPKTITAKGFIMSRTPYENPTLLRPQKRDSSVKAKTVKISNSSALESSAQNQKPREEKRSSSKQKCETLRTVSGTPKNLLPYKTAESVRREDTSYSQNQYRYRKLEISTEFNGKSSYTNKAQTTKNTETDENISKETPKTSTKHQSSHSAQKSAQNKTEQVNYNCYTEQNADENKAKEPVQSRTSRPLSSYDSNYKSVPAAQPQGPTKANHQIRNKSKHNEPSERESSSSKPSYRKDKMFSSTPKGSLNAFSNEEASSNVENKRLVSTYGDLKAAGQGYSSEAVKRKERPLSAKKNPKEEQQSERASSKDTPKSSLQSFVTKVNKGDAFGSIKKYGDNKRDNSAQRSQKLQLNLDDKSSKAGRAIDMDSKGSKTTTNAESKVFSVTLGRTSASPTAASSQQVVTKNNKKGSSAIKEAQKQETVARTRAQGKEAFIYYMSHLEKAHKWDGEPDYFVQIYQEHFLQTFQALNFCRALKPTDPVVLAQKRVNFPKRDTHKDKKTLVFDMDETLIHCNESLDMPADVILPIMFPNGEVVEAGINIRPYAIEILRELSQYYEIMVFTASHSCYANVVLDYLDPHEEFIHHRLFRESCVVTEEGLHIKDLRVIGNRNIQDLILIDNAAYSFGFQLENGIPIIPFYDNKADQELRHLIPYLKFLSSVKDLREINKQTFKLHHYGNYEEPEEFLEKVIFQG